MPLPDNQLIAPAAPHIEPSFVRTSPAHPLPNGFAGDMPFILNPA
jgi:hypothetical protein